MKLVNKNRKEKNKVLFKVVLFLITIIILFIPFVVSQTHTSSQIRGGNFSNSDYEFPLNLYVNQSFTIRNGDLNLNNNALLNVDWSSTTTTSLDADLLDGENGAYYLDNTDYCSDGSCSGALTTATINTGSGAMELGDAAVANGDTNSIPTGDQVYDFVMGQGFGTGSGDITDVSTSLGSCGSGNCNLLTIDGSTSGLDADKIDNIDSSYILYGGSVSGSGRASVTEDLTELEQYKSGFWDVNGASWTPDTNWWWGSTFAHQSNSPTYNFGAQLIFKNSLSPTMFIRGISGGASPSSGAWQEVWTNYSDGPSSGLDADTLDGSHASSFYQGSVSSFADGDTLPTCASGSHLYNNGGVLACSSTDDDVPESGDFGAAADLDASGQVADDSHNHIYSNIDATTSANWATRVSDETGTGNMVFSSSPTLTTPRTAELRAASSAGLKLYEDGGTTGIFINDSGAVGIGTTNPEQKLDVAGAIRLNASNHQIILHDTSTNEDEWSITTYNNEHLAFFKNGTTSKVVIEAGGKVGIGTTSPQSELNVHNTGETVSVWVTGDDNQYESVTLGSGYYDRWSMIHGLNNELIFWQDHSGDGGVSEQGMLLDSGGSLTLSKYLYLSPINAVNEGGQLTLYGAGAYGDVNIDNYAGHLRVFTLASGKELQVLGGSGVAANGYRTISDIKFKTNITNITNPLIKVQNLRGVNFVWKNDNRKDIGFIAQEVEKVVPELVNTNNDSGEKSVAYSNIVALNVEAIKELKSEKDYEFALIKKENQDLKSDNAKLKLAICSIDGGFDFCN